MKRISIYDTTLRDGAQAEEISLSVADKIKIAQKLDELGVDFIEGGWPGANPKDTEFFLAMKKKRLKKAKLVAFAATTKGNESQVYKQILASGVKYVCLFGKTWDLHVRETLRVTKTENLKIIAQSIAFFKKRGFTVFFDAEHFFDGYKANSRYALECLNAATDAGAEVIVLCDTNGGSLPEEVFEIVSVVGARHAVPVGIHCHNDGELAVANTLAAVRAGVTQVQGTINGIGERCGNVNLISVIANLKLKMGFEVLGGPIRRLTEASRFIDQILNRHASKGQPFVGQSAFAHKGGVHVSAVLKQSQTYEHIDPSLVGNTQRFLLSDQSGGATVAQKLKELGFKTKGIDVKKVLNLIKEREKHGYSYEDAEASFYVLVKRATKTYKPHFELVDFKVVDDIQADEKIEPKSSATIHFKVGSVDEVSAAIGVGPVHALDQALRKTLTKFYPQLKNVSLVDYKVRVLSSGTGTKSVVRVHIDFNDGVHDFSTVGLSENIIQASYLALVDGIDYFLSSRLYA